MLISQSLTGCCEQVRNSECMMKARVVWLQQTSFVTEDEME